jgi:hypothetical protein
VQVQMGRAELILLLGNSRIGIVEDRTLVNSHGICEGAREEVIVAFGDLRKDRSKRNFFFIRQMKNGVDVSTIWGH